MSARIGPWFLVGALALAAAGAQAEVASPLGIARAERALAEHGYSPAGLEALGQAELAAGQLGSAIASFERGLVLSPRSHQLQAELRDARARAGLPPQECRGPLGCAPRWFSLREWAFGGFACTLALCIGLLGLSVARRRRAWFGALLAVAAVLGTCVGAGFALSHAALQRAYALGECDVRESPFTSARALGRVHPGEAMEPHESHGDFVYVESELGARGWIPRDRLARIAAGGAPAS